MIKLQQLIEETRKEREWFADRFRKTGNHGHSIEAAACAIREKALLDAFYAVQEPLR